MYAWGSYMNSYVVVIPFMIVWGISTILWPAFAVRAVRGIIRHSER